MRSVKHGRAMGLSGAVVLVTSLVAVGSPSAPIAAAGELPTISGTVFMDYSLDGVLDTGEPGQVDVDVRAFDADGAEVGTATTSATGEYTLTLATAHTGIVRLEFEVPTGLNGTLVSAAEGSAGSSVQFVAPGSTDVDFGVIDPTTACSLLLAHVCFREGINTERPDSRVLGISPFSPPATTGSTPKAIGDPGTNSFGATIADEVPGLITEVATKGAVGATWGVAVDRSTGLLWNSAVIRRHLGLGPEGIGGLYVYTRDGTQVASFDLENLGGDSLDLRPTAQALGLPAAYAGGTATNKVIFSDANRDIRANGNLVAQADTPTQVTEYPARSPITQSRDIPAFAAVGKAGIGDIDISKDNTKLWVTNLNTRTVHRYTIGGTASAPTIGGLVSWNPADGHTCATGTGPLRIWGLDPQADGTVVVGGVCTNESATPGPTQLPGLGVILKLDPTATGAAAWTELTTVDFDYEHVYDYCLTSAMTCSWKSWTDDFNAIKTNSTYSASQLWWTQPLIADIATLPDGSFAVGINDRFSYQASANNYAPLDARDPGYITAYTAGGLRLLCKTASGWVQEDGGNCAGTTSYESSRTGSFFRNDFQGAHPATSQGALTYANGVLAYAAMDAASYFTSGVRWLSASTGNQVNALTTTAEFGKASGMGDIEAFCDEAPLQIGNRVWYDYNGDGIQDPDEPPVVGVTLTLYDVTGATVVGQAVTNEFGEYYFTSTNTEDPTTTAGDDEFGGGLEAGKTYEVRLALADDCAEDGPLDGWDLTVQNGTTTDGPASRDDLIDSDASEEGTSGCLYKVATVAVASMTPGSVNHSYDIGFVVPNVSVGDLVWVDLNGNGTLDPEEAGLAGVTLTITDANGDPVTDVFGRTVDTLTTDEFGRYRFALLPLGSYRVTITVPSGYTLVSGFTEMTTSVDLTAYGTLDRLLDFGLVRAAESATTTTEGSTTTVAPPADETPTTALSPAPASLPATGSTAGMVWMPSALFLALGVGALISSRRRAER